MLITDKINRRMIMKKSLSLIVSVLFAALCLGFSFSAYADDAKVLTDANVTLSQQSFVYDGTAKNPAVIYLSLIHI